MGLLSIERARGLGRPVFHEDVHPIPVRRFALQGLRLRGLPAPASIAPGGVVARMDAGRWLADCPTGCGGAELVSVFSPQFTCLSCGSGGQWWPVIFPVNRAEIDAEVSKRASVLAWAWNVGESLTALRRETLRLKGG